MTEHEAPSGRANHATGKAREDLSAARDRPWPPYEMTSVCGHMRRDVVSQGYPATRWCDTCVHYVTVHFRRKSCAK